MMLKELQPTCLEKCPLDKFWFAEGRCRASDGILREGWCWVPNVLKEVCGEFYFQPTNLPQVGIMEHGGVSARGMECIFSHDNQI